MDEQTPHLSVVADTDGHRADVVVSGDVDTGTADALEEQLGRIIDAGARSIDLDLAGLDFIDSWGLRVLITVRDRAELLGGRLRITSATDQVCRLLKMTGLEGLLSEAVSERD